MASPSNPLIAGTKGEGADIEVPADGVQLKAYMSGPSGGGTAPAVIVIHENRGLMPYLRDVVDGLASNGYIAIAPDLLSHEGGTASVEDIPTALRGIPKERHVSAVQAVVKYLKAQSGVGKIGIIGFCFGGGIVWQSAADCPDIAAAVPFYGGNPTIESVPNIHAAVYAVYGELDERINAGIPAITEALKAAGTTYEMKVYSGANHAFHNHTNPPERYHAEAAVAAWGDALKWFETHLKG